MNLLDVLNVTRNPLPLSVLLYLGIAGLVVWARPKIIFGDEDKDKDKYVNTYHVWLFFILLAVFVYAIVCSYASNKIREDYCSKLLSKDFKTLIDVASCKK